jgi:hypothetical protein
VFRKKSGLALSLGAVAAGVRNGEAKRQQAATTPNPTSAGAVVKQSFKGGYVMRTLLRILGFLFPCSPRTGGARHVRVNPKQYQGDYTGEISEAVRRLKQQEVRDNAFFYLQQLSGVGRSAAVPPLLSALSGADDDLQNMVILLLEHYGSEAHEAVPALQRLLQSGTPAVQQLAKRALLRIRTLPGTHPSAN